MLPKRLHLRPALLLVVVLVAAILSVGLGIGRKRLNIRGTRPDNCVDTDGQPLTNEDGLFHLRCIDRNAQIAESGDVKAVENLADTVVEFSQVGAVPESFLEPFKERLVKSELEFRAGSQKGIEEGDIVLALNNLEDKLGAPEYARAHRDEVDFLRQDFSASIPHLIKKTGTISPIESVFLLDQLVYQKINNEGFLLTPAERNSKSNILVQPKGTTSPTLVVIHPRVKEMMNFVNRAATRSPKELAGLAHQLMDDLSMDK